MQDISPSVAMVSSDNPEFGPLLDGLRARNFRVFFQPTPASVPNGSGADVLLACCSPFDQAAIDRLSPWLTGNVSPLVVASKAPPPQLLELAALRQGVDEVVAVGDSLSCEPVCAAILRSLTRHRSRQARTESPSSEQAQNVVDLFPVAVIVANADGTVRLTNRLAQGLLAERQAIYIDPLNRVRLTHRAQDARLYAVVQAVQSGEDSDCALEAPRRDGGPALSVLVVPVGRGVNGQPRGVTLFVSDPDQSLALHPETLEGLYGLTMAEAKLVIALVSGQTLDVVAAASGTSLNTLRNQLKAVFRKTDTNRQADLMKRVLTGPAVFRRD